MEYDFSSVPKESSKKIELLNLFKPNFSITINPNGDIQRIPKAILDINPEMIEINYLNRSKNISNCAKNRNDAVLESKGLTKLNIKLSKQIMKIFNASVENEMNYENSKTNNNISEKFSYVNTSYYPKLAVNLSPATIQLNPDIIKRFEEILSLDNLKEKRKKLYEIYNLYGMYIPSGFILGGKYNIFIEAKNEEENNQKLQEFKNTTNFFIAEQKMDFQYDNINKNKISNKAEDINKNIEIEGGNINSKSLEDWKKSFNLNNLEIIEYLNLEKIYKKVGDDNLSKKIEELEESMLNEQEIINKEEEKKIIDDMKKLEITLGILSEEESERKNILKAIKNIYSISSQNSEDSLEITKILNISDENKN